jgi:hemolysin III
MTRPKEKKTIIQPSYSTKEDLANSVTHGIGTVLSLIGLALLVILATKSGDVWRVVSFSVYGSSLVILYLSSTLYHGIQKPHIKRLLRVLDHSTIYLLIAGSYTPFLLVSMRGAWGWSLFGVVWGLALLGIVFKVFFIGRFEALATAAYVLMGWLVVIAFNEMTNSVPPGGITLLVAGGLTYTLGVVFYAWKKLPFNHAIWHLFVLGGSACHFFAVLYYVLPMA